jgi:hypothetical protein
MDQPVRVPVVRMKRPIVYQPKPRVIQKQTLRTKRDTQEHAVVRTKRDTQEHAVVRTKRDTQEHAVVRTKRAPMPKPLTRKTMKRPSPVLSNTNMRSANRLYDPQHPKTSPVVNAGKLFRKMEELQDMLARLMKKRSRPKLSMNRSAKVYLNAASYEDPLDLNDDLKLKGVKGTAFG